MPNDTIDHVEPTSSKLPDRLLTNVETADYIGVHPKTLVRARVYGGNLARLAHVKVGRNVRYRLSDVEQFLRVNTAHTVDQHRFA